MDLALLTGNCSGMTRNEKKRGKRCNTRQDVTKVKPAQDKAQSVANVASQGMLVTAGGKLSQS